MARETKTVRNQMQTRKALDGIAGSLGRDYVVDLQWQINHIRQGLREANAGEFATEAEVNRTISRLRTK
jgi:predicted transcriptional regulator